MTAPERTVWFDIAQAFARLTEVTGSSHLARRLLQHSLAEGRIRSRAAFIAMAPGAMPQPVANREELPAGFWKHAEVDWEDLAKPIIRHLIFVAGKERTRLPYLEVYTVTLSPDFEYLILNERAERPALHPNLHRPNISEISRPRGPAPQTRGRIVAQMKQMPAAELRAMKEVTMETHFGASRDTCRKARKEVLSDIAEN